MIHAICDFCGKDCDRTATLLSMTPFQNFARYHTDNEPYGNREKTRSFVICYDCCKKHNLPIRMKHIQGLLSKRDIMRNALIITRILILSKIKSTIRGLIKLKFRRKKVMKKSILIAIATITAICFTGCQSVTKSFGGTTTINLEPNQSWRK